MFSCVKLLLTWSKQNGHIKIVREKTLSDVCYNVTGRPQVDKRFNPGRLI